MAVSMLVGKNILSFGQILPEGGIMPALRKFFVRFISGDFIGPVDILAKRVPLAIIVPIGFA